MTKLIITNNKLKLHSIKINKLPFTFFNKHIGEIFFVTWIEGEGLSFTYQIITDIKHKTNDFNEYFTSTGQHLASKLVPGTPYFQNSEFLISSCNCCYVEKHLLTMSENKLV